LKKSAQDTVPALHLLSLFLTKAEGVISQIRMGKGDNEITTALRLIEMTDIEGKKVPKVPRGNFEPIPRVESAISKS
jgi:16S rRNA A1518/A1519 N6-dimethyltransferase RsmA/KsgA/DIM1 with predicted DNA glycosylase/AP lyase activity